MSVVSVVCCQVEGSATSWSFVQRSPTECGVSQSVIVKPRTMRRPRPPRGCRVIGKKTYTLLWLGHKFTAEMKWQSLVEWSNWELGMEKTTRGK
jgi:hypothetical protein